MAERIEGRKVLRIAGPDRVAFLQGLVTNDVRRIAQGPVYAALLTAQGKYLADFFLTPGGPADTEAILLDVAEPLADGLLRRLALYRLRADVTIEPTDLPVHRGFPPLNGGPLPDGAWPDPRDAALGWRAVGLTAVPDGPAADYDRARVALLVPDTGTDLVPDDSYILEFGFERLHGVDFRKGCYVGQEVTARMKHKAELRRGLFAVALDGQASPGARIETADGKEAGRLGTVAGDRGLALLRIDRAGGALSAGGAGVRVLAAPAAAQG